MKSIASCLVAILLLLGNTAAKSSETEPTDENSQSVVTPEDRHAHHSLFSLFQRHTDAGGTCTRLLVAPFFSLYRNERWSDQRDLRILSLPIIGSLYRHRIDGIHHRREFLFLIDIESDR